MPTAVHAGLSGIGWLKKETDGSGASYYIVADSAQYNFDSGNDPWGIKGNASLTGFAFNESSASGKFSNVLVYDFDQASHQITSYGGHDLLLPSQADTIIASNNGNPYWISTRLDQFNGKITLDQDGDPQPGKYWPNGYVLPWSGFHNASASFKLKSDQASFPSGYDQTVTWTQTDNPPTLDSVSITDSAGSTIKSGDTWNVTTGFTSMGDRSKLVPEGTSTSHHYYAALWDSNNQFIKPIKLANGGFDAVGIPLKVRTFNNYQDTGSQPIYVYNPPSATSGSDKFTIPASETAGLQDGQTYYVAFYIMDDLHRYAVKTVPITINKQPTPPSQSGDMKGSDLDPQATGEIRAMSRGSEQFDVLQGIPTSESLYANAHTKDFLYNYDFVQKSGEEQFNVTVNKTYHLTWTETSTDADGNTVSSPQAVDVPVQNTYVVKRPYSYWEINELEVMKLNNAHMDNYALPNGTVNLSPSPTYYSAPGVTVWHSDSLDDHVPPPIVKEVDAGSESVPGGDSQPPTPSEDLSSYAEQGVPPKLTVKDDHLVVKTTTVMDNTPQLQDGPKPGSFPTPVQVGPDVLYAPDQKIDDQKLNKQSAPSSGEVTYALLSNGQVNPNSELSAPYTKPINNINDVTVHTPVVDYPSVSDDKAHNQKTVPNTTRDALILDRNFTVTLPTTGQHRTIKGYGNRDYDKYTLTRQVSFPFDVYLASDLNHVIKPNTWVVIPKGQISLQFFLPVWVNEGNYNVSFRAAAINSPNSGFTTQNEANLDLNNYVAINTVPVEVIGRVFNFHVTDVADYNWQSVFRKSDGKTPTYNSYWVGLDGIDGTARGNQSPYILPIRPGSNPTTGKGNVSVKTGYHFKFDLDTKGNMFGPEDGIRITPSFYFMDQSGTIRKPVDLYYHTKDNPFVKVGSAQDTVKRFVILNTPLRNVPTGEFSDTARFYYDQLSLSQQANTSYTDYLDMYERSAAKQTWVGNYDLEILPWPVRTFIGSKTNLPTTVTVDRANAAVQKWYGEYSLPAAPYVVTKGTDLSSYRTLDDNSSVFLKHGYIIVNFNIETIQNMDLDHPHLQYIYGPLDNQWKMEGFVPSSTPNFNYGDVILYDTDRSSQDDFGNGGTH